MVFPEAVWQAFPDKQGLVRELAYVLTLAPPLILQHPTVWYHSPEPRAFDLYNECFEGTIPNLTDPIGNESAGEILARFRATGRHFPSRRKHKPKAVAQSAWDPRRVVLPFSFGKDCLTSLATLHRLGYEVFPVCLDDRVLPRGTAIRADMQKKMAASLDLQCLPVRNEIQLLSDYQILKQPPTHLHRVHIYFVYLLAMLPFCYYYAAPVIVLNNEFCLSLDRLHREGFLLPHRVMQSPPVTRKMRALIERLSGGCVTVVNLIGGLGDFSINRLLHHTFSDYGVYRVSCHMEVSAYKRWCHNCERCAQAYLFARATGCDPAMMGFETSMLTAGQRDLFFLFRENSHPRDAYARYFRRAEMLAFTMARKRGVAEPLVDYFQQVVGPVAKRARRKLHRAVFKVHGRSGRHVIEKEAHRMYRERMAGFRKEDGY